MTGGVRDARRSVPLVFIAFECATGLALRLAVLARPISVIDRQFVPDDTYYTLTIARSIANGHGPTIDGSTATSGFQPLLGFLMTPVYWLTKQPDTALRIDLALLVVVDVATIGLLAWLAYRVGGRIAAVVAGGLWALSPIAVSMALGGLETSLAIFLEVGLVVAWIWANDRPARRRWFAVGAVAGLAALARIDALLLVGLLVALQLWRGPRRPLVASVVAGALIAGPWWLWCTLTFGTPLPTSGPAAHDLASVAPLSRLSSALSLGAVSGSPFALSGWLRLRLFNHPKVGAILFWSLVASLLALTVAASLKRTRSAYPRDSVQGHGPGPLAITATLAAFAAGLLVFYAWFGVAWYLTRYLAPVALVLTLMLALLCERVLSLPTRLKYALCSALMLSLVIGTTAALRTDLTYLTAHDGPARKLGSIESTDAMTGYRDSAIQLLRAVGHDRVLGAAQSGALAYYADPNVVVVNLDGVVNPDASQARHSDRLGQYMSRRHIDTLADTELVVLYFVSQLSRVDPPPTLRHVGTYSGGGRSFQYALEALDWTAPRPDPCAQLRTYLDQARKRSDFSRDPRDAQRFIAYIEQRLRSATCEPSEQAPSEETRAWIACGVRTAGPHFC